jgi:hypothetical protein
MTIVCRHGTPFVALDQGVDVDINSYKNAVYSDFGSTNG